MLKSGKPARSARLAVYRRPNCLACARIGLIIPKRLVPLAVERNRIRRVVREVFRMRQALIGESDCVVRLVKVPGDDPITHAEIEALLLRGPNAR